MKSETNIGSAAGQSAEALSAASKALKGELEVRKKLEDELERTKPELTEALKSSERAQSLAEDVLTREVSTKVLQIAVQESAEALADAAAALKHELEKRGELENALEETEGALVAGVQKSEQAAAKLKEPSAEDSASDKD
jgi:hypothetical protein